MLEPRKNSKNDQNFKESKEPYAFRPFTCTDITANDTSPVPYPRSGHRISVDVTNLYSFGGYNPEKSTIMEAFRFYLNPPANVHWINSFPLFQELWRFNFARRQWMRYPNSHTLPLELASNAMLLRGHSLMVYGGTGSPFGNRCSNQLFVYRVDNDHGEMMEINTNGQLPVPMYGQSIILHNGFMYTIGGTTGLEYTLNIHRLNVKTLDWEVVYQSEEDDDGGPEGRYRHEVGFNAATGDIYVLGGGTANSAFGFREIPTFNLKQRAWRWQWTHADRRHGLPSPRRCHGAVQTPSASDTGEPQYIFIAGGTDGLRVFDDVWRLELVTMHWSLMEQCRMPRALYFHAMAANEAGKLYVFGGIQSDSVTRSNRVFSAWLCVPQLSEICWEALLHYFPYLVDCDSASLVDAGLPRRFLQRIA